MFYCDSEKEQAVFTSLIILTLQKLNTHGDKDSNVDFLERYFRFAVTRKLSTIYIKNEEIVLCSDFGIVFRLRPDGEVVAHIEDHFANTYDVPWQFNPETNPKGLIFKAPLAVYRTFKQYVQDDQNRVQFTDIISTILQVKTVLSSDETEFSLEEHVKLCNHILETNPNLKIKIKEYLHKNDFNVIVLRDGLNYHFDKLESKEVFVM